MYGRVIGINTAIISPTGGSIGIGFAIPSLLAENVVDQLREFGETRRGWLGIRLQEVTEEIADGLGLADTSGAIVMGVVPNGPSDTGQIEIGDVIIRFDGRPVPTSRDLPRLVAETEVGKRVTLTLMRKESQDAEPRSIDVEVTLGRLEDGEAMMEQQEGSTEEGGEEVAPEAAIAGTLGMTLADMSDELKTQFGIDEIASARGADAGAVLAVGDGANDLPMILAAGTGVALHAKPAVAAKAPFRVDHSDLTGLLFLQGYKAEQFIAA